MPASGWMCAPTLSTAVTAAIHEARALPKPNYRPGKDLAIRAAMEPIHCNVVHIR